MKCDHCGKSYDDPTYKKKRDEWGNSESLYWWNPKLCPLSDGQLLIFCGPECSTKWYLEVTAK
jgi:hypothetical protein